MRSSILRSTSSQRGKKTPEPYKNMTLHDQTGDVFILKQKAHESKEKLVNRQFLNEIVVLW